MDPVASYKSPPILGRQGATASGACSSRGLGAGDEEENGDDDVDGGRDAGFVPPSA